MSALGKRFMAAAAFLQADRLRRAEVDRLTAVRAREAWKAGEPARRAAEMAREESDFERAWERFERAKQKFSELTLDDPETPQDAPVPEPSRTEAQADGDSQATTEEPPAYAWPPGSWARYIRPMDPAQYAEALKIREAAELAAAREATE